MRLISINPNREIKLTTIIVLKFFIGKLILKFQFILTWFNSKAA